MSEDKQITRRDFGRAALRALGLAGLGTLAAALLSRPGAIRPCDRRGWCRECGRLSACVLPQAKSFRRLHEENRDGRG